MTSRESLFKGAPDILPPRLTRGMDVRELVDVLGKTSFEARNVARGARLLKRMIQGDDVIWLGIAGAGIAGGMGGMVSSLLEAGFVDVICSTGAQVYHDLHFAFDLPVKAISPRTDDNELRRRGDTRIYDIGIREQETLEAQDAMIRDFVRSRWEKDLSGRSLSSWELDHALGLWVQEHAPHPERSFVASAARLGVPVFWDSLANHSIAMNLARTDREGFPVILSAQKDLFDSAAIVFSSDRTGFLELGGGGPKNFIQQTGPFIRQILGVDFEGADRGLQIGTAVEREGSLSSCTFSEAVTWGKYREAEEDKLIQIWGEYSVLFPLLAAYALETCEERPARDLTSRMDSVARGLDEAL
ncbi:MAG: deoxyhypusine synthase family protein [Desulfobacteraceae bacterium]